MSPGFSLRFLVIALLISSPATVVSSAQIDASQVGLLPRSSDNAYLSKTRSTVVRSNVDLVLVPVLVTNSRNESITNLRKEDFRVTQDSVEQHIREPKHEEQGAALA
jgi:hypothetical protein